MQRTRYQGRFLEFLEYKDERVTWEFVRRPRSIQGVTIVAATKKNKIVVVEQYRIPFGKLVIELPAGLVGDCDSNDAPEMAARRELREETGYACEEVETICAGALLPGLTDEINTLCWAKQLRASEFEDATDAAQVYVHEQSHGNEAESERIQVYDIPLAGAEAWLKNQQVRGKIVDLKVLLGVYFLRNVLGVCPPLPMPILLK